MPHPGKARGPRIYACNPVWLSWPVLLIVLALGITGTSITGSAEAATLNEVRVGNHGDYIRIVFQLSSQVEYQLNQDTGASSITIRFFKTDTTISKSLELAQASCLAGVNTLQQDDQLVAQLRFNSGWNKLNPFILRGPDRMVLDVFCGEGGGAGPAPTEIQLDQAPHTPEAKPEEKPKAKESSPTLTTEPQMESETTPVVAKEPLVTEPATPSASGDEIRGQKPITKNKQAAKPVAAPKVVPQKKDPFQKYLLILLAAITGVIIILIALIVIQKESQPTDSDDIRDNTRVDPDETMRAIDQQIKTKLMKYDDQ
jgi:hypothetical protein